MEWLIKIINDSVGVVCGLDRNQLINHSFNQTDNDNIMMADEVIKKPREGTRCPILQSEESIGADICFF